MRIGIVGAGMIGGTLGALWARAGHAVLFGTRHPDALGPLLQRVGHGAQAGTVIEACTFGEVVFCSVPYGAWPNLAPIMAQAVAGKVVIDSGNPYPERDGAFAVDAIAAGDGAGVPVARLLPAARLVRAFNTVYFKVLEGEAHRAGERVGIPLAADDAAALAAAAALTRDAGFEPVVVGNLARARDFDPDSAVYNTGKSGAEVARMLGVPRHDQAQDLGG